MEYYKYWQIMINNKLHQTQTSNMQWEKKI